MVSHNPAFQFHPLYLIYKLNFLFFLPPKFGKSGYDEIMISPHPPPSNGEGLESIYRRCKMCGVDFLLQSMAPYPRYILRDRGSVRGRGGGERMNLR